MILKFYLPLLARALSIQQIHSIGSGEGFRFQQHGHSHFSMSVTVVDLGT